VWRVLASETVGTALLVFGGLSVVIVMFRIGSPMEQVLPSIVWRRVITGFLFGCVGPCLGTLLAILVFSALAKRIEVAKLYHFESERRRLFHGMAS
jgi:glycerol uptake facilitator-like aquaporin